MGFLSRHQQWQQQASLSLLRQEGGGPPTDRQEEEEDEEEDRPTRIQPSFVKRPPSLLPIARCCDRAKAGFLLPPPPPPPPQRSHLQYLQSLILSLCVPLPLASFPSAVEAVGTGRGEEEEEKMGTEDDDHCTREDARQLLKKSNTLCAPLCLVE